MFRTHKFAALLVTIGLLVSAAARGQADPSGTTLSVGAVKDAAEAAVVRVFIKQVEGWNVDDKLVMSKKLVVGRETFYTMSRKFEIDATDKGTLGGVVLRYGARAYNVRNELDAEATRVNDGKPVISIDSGAWIHVFPVELGFDSDRSLKNRDVLLEAGYVPLHLNTGNCFKLGANPIVGVSAQWGRRTRDTAAAVPAGQKAEASGSLRRLKADARFELPFSCVLKATRQPSEADSASVLSVLGADLSQWTILTAATGWRDFVEHRTYKRYELVLRIPTGKNTFMDLKRELGAAPTNFDTGAKFSANLTVQF